jgi:hypothetical protein
MTIQVAQSCQASESSGNSVTTPVMTQYAGNLSYVAIAAESSANVPTVTDSQGNSYTKLLSAVYNTGGTGRYLTTYYSNNVVGGATSVTASISGNHPMTVVWLDITYAANSGVFDQSNTNASEQAAPYGAYVPLTAVPAAGEIVVGTLVTGYSYNPIVFNTSGSTQTMTIQQQQTNGDAGYPTICVATAVVTANETFTVYMSDGSPLSFFALGIDCFFGGTDGPVIATPRPFQVRNRPYFV